VCHARIPLVGEDVNSSPPDVIRWHSARVPEIRFDERIAAGYDAASTAMFEPALLDRTTAFLAQHARGGRALELGIGTGRVALPLHERGVPVHGIELSPAMADRLSAKPGAARIGVTIGDFATARVEGTFRLAYLVYNTITNLMTQDEQVACFRNVADHLEPGGRFVVEVFVPQLQRLPPGETVRAFEVQPHHLGFDEYDVVTQTLHSHHYWIVGGKAERFVSPHRYVWPAELDLMARIAGMKLVERWAGWDRSPFTAESESHVSVWEKPA
jgi:SAM-dependent methyltransferase